MAGDGFNDEFDAVIDDILPGHLEESVQGAAAQFDTKRLRVRGCANGTR